MSANVTRRFRTRTERRMFARSRFVINLAYWSHSAVNSSTKIAATATTRPATWSGRAAAQRSASCRCWWGARASARLSLECASVHVGRGEPPPRNRSVRIIRGRRRGTEIPYKGRWLFVLGEICDATRRDARFSVTDLPRVEPRAARDATTLACLPACVYAPRRARYSFCL